MSWADKRGKVSETWYGAKLDEGVYCATLVRIGEPFVVHNRQYGTSIKVSFDWWPDVCDDPKHLISDAVNLPMVPGASEQLAETKGRLPEDMYNLIADEYGSRMAICQLASVLGGYEMVKGKDGKVEKELLPSKMLGARAYITVTKGENRMYIKREEIMAVESDDEPPDRVWKNPWTDKGQKESRETAPKEIVEYIRELATTMKKAFGGKEGEQFIKRVNRARTEFDPKSTKLNNVSVEGANRLITWMRDEYAKAEIEFPEPPVDSADEL